MRPIDADALMTDLDQTIRVSAREENSAEMRGIRKVLDRIKAAPTLSPDDVRGVGHWVGIDDFPHESWECDRCGCVVENTDDPWNYFHYCPNCGARMKGAEDGTTD